MQYVLIESLVANLSALSKDSAGLGVNTCKVGHEQLVGYMDMFIQR